MIEPEKIAVERPARVLLVDDQVLYREGLRELVRRWPEFEVVGEASNGKEAVECCRQNPPDLVLMDVQMPVMDGVEAAGV
ncbi:response regulator transcription factor, partial [Gordonibacter sp.]